MPELERSIEDAAHAIGHASMIRGLTVAVCESLTSGQIATTLGAVPEASEWFSGSLVAYRNQTKFDVLGIEEGPVVTAECAERMAAGIRDLTHADVAVSITGVGGPGSEEDKDAGTVFIGVSSARGTRSFQHHFDGNPEEIVLRSVYKSLTHLQGAVLAA
jgi:nicotinamide-nucleotide amidase